MLYNLTRANEDLYTAMKRFIDRYQIRIAGKQFNIKREYEKKVAANYARKISELRNAIGQRAITVGFLVRENTKWSYESLYHQLTAHPDFTPLVLIADDGKILSDTAQNEKFFKDYNYRVIRKQSDFRKLHVDILFYEQAWFDLSGDFTPEQLSPYALTFYVPYALKVRHDANTLVPQSVFFKAVYRSFCFCRTDEKDLHDAGIFNTSIVGHPRTDAYLEPVRENPWKSTGKTRIIYAPHHSFANSYLKLGTWEWSGRHLLELARKSQDSTEWIFKPHPRFKYELTKLFKSEAKAQAIMDEWAEVSQLYDKGNYFDLFKTSDLMICDCLSFKMEWLPSGKPYIQLNSRYKDFYAFDEADYYTEHYYKADTTEDIDRLFNMLVHQKEDPLKEARQARAKDFPMGVATKIIRELEEIIRGSSGQ